MRLSSGLRITQKDPDNGDDSPQTAGTLVADLNYGDPFSVPYSAPFDVFNVRLQISTGGGGVTMLRAGGRLFGREIRGNKARHQHQFIVNQRYDYVSNPSQNFGSQSVEMGIHSRWRLPHQFGFRSQVFVDGVVLGAVDAPNAGGGAAADHVNFGGLEINLPVARGLGVGAHLGSFERYSKYAKGNSDRREYPEARFFDLDGVRPARPGGAAMSRAWKPIALLVAVPERWGIPHGPAEEAASVAAQRLLGGVGRGRRQRAGRMRRL